MEILSLGSFALVLIIGLLMAVFRSDFGLLAITATLALFAIAVFTGWHALHKFGFVSHIPTLDGVAAVFTAIGFILYAVDSLLGLRDIYRLIFHHGETFDE
jgi:hypothetical protein